MILGVPLSISGMEDFVAWRYTNNSLFAVGSAYHSEWKHRFGSRARNIYAPRSQA
jgi:hypothetical protein